jgi:hypothetical protein
MAIKGTLHNSSILAVVTPFGYDQVRMEEGLALYNEAQLLNELKSKAYGEQAGATTAVKRMREEAAVAYTAALKIARVAFVGKETARNALVLDGLRKKSLSGWLDQARRFYNNILRTPEFLEVMTAYNYPQGKLTAEAALVEGVWVKSELQDKERGKAQSATKRRNVTLAALDRWVADYKKVAEVAFAHSPQDLEQLGWLVRS